MWGRLRPNARFWNLMIDDATVLVGKIVMTSQAKRLFLIFLWNEKAPARSRKCEDVSGQTPVLGRNLSIFSVQLSVNKIWPDLAAKLWGRLRPNAHVCFFYVTFLGKILAPERARNCEDVSRQTLVCEKSKKKYFTVFSAKLSSENVRTSQANHPFWEKSYNFSVHFCNKIKKKKRRRTWEREIVRTSQAKRPFLFFLLNKTSWKKLAQI